MITSRWIEEPERIEYAIYRADSQYSLDKMNDLKKKGWKINSNYCIDEKKGKIELGKNGKPVRYYLMARKVTTS